MKLELAPGGIQRRNPCPKCSEVPQLVAGVVLGQVDHLNYLVCWDCKQVRAVLRGQEWTGGQSLPRARQKRHARDDYDRRPRR